ncbi:MarR family winged helix-turn-helix transcriptional regulator [Phytohalomonas tamaricis]|uniref:MarR family winged helix-turn-helix transcriptional regulator n=1 Tax=Phytohalomonas tamaricis TaxID=2081032 RepID=UPI000D0BDF24|nr:MarR family transcriptional regulator [Phytohalomonas tamaricis]
MRVHEDEGKGHRQLGYLLGRTALLKDRLLDTHLAELGITAAQLKVLANIALGHMQRPSDLCQLFNIDSGAMTRMLDRLEKKQLILRQRDAQDRRMIKIDMTAKGNDVVSRGILLAEQALNELTHALSAEEFGQLTACLQKILISAGVAPFFADFTRPHGVPGGKTP